METWPHGIVESFDVIKLAVELWLLVYNPHLNLPLLTLSGFLRGRKIETQGWKMICISYSLDLNLFIDSTHRLATGQQARGHRPSAEAVLCLKGSSYDTGFGSSPR